MSEHNSDLMVKPSRSTFKKDHKGNVYSTLDHKEVSLYKHKKYRIAFNEATKEVKNYL